MPPVLGSEGGGEDGWSGWRGSVTGRGCSGTVEAAAAAAVSDAICVLAWRSFTDKTTTAITNPMDIKPQTIAKMERGRLRTISK
jgi:hypothetical protein